MKNSVHVLQSYTAQDQIYLSLRQRIMSGAFAPGEHISINQTAEAFGVSAMPAREALLRLAAEGIVETAPKKAAMIPRIGLERFREILDLRCVLEPMALELAIPKLDKTMMRRLETLDARMKRAIIKQQPETYSDLNFQFHFQIFNASGSPLLIDYIEKLWLLAGPTMKWHDPDGLRVGADLHKELLDAVSAKNVEAARGWLIADIRAGTDYLIKAGGLLESDPIQD